MIPMNRRQWAVVFLAALASLGFTAAFLIGGLWLAVHGVLSAS
jgi:hypothetical protein